MAEYIFRQIKTDEEVAVCNLVARTFNEFIAPEFSEEGIEEFFKYSNPREFLRRAQAGYFSMLAETSRKLVGMIEIKSKNHISMLYVDKEFHRHGVAKSLIKNALSQLIPDICDSHQITVNSSRYAVPFYERLGFLQFDEEKTIYGVIHIPMMVNYSKLQESL